MDPISIAAAAIQVLDKVKEQLDECHETISEAADLKKAIELFECTIMMVPNKQEQSTNEGKYGSSIKIPEEGDDENGEEEEEEDIIELAQEVGTGVETAKGVLSTLSTCLSREHTAKIAPVANVAANVTSVYLAAVNSTPAAILSSLFQITEDGEPVFSSRPPPATTLQNLKMEMKDGFRVHSDLDVMLVGMAFIIRFVCMCGAHSDVDALTYVQ